TPPQPQTDQNYHQITADSNNKKINYPDQDILNLMFLHHAKILPRKYNCIYTIKSECEEKNSEYYTQFINDETVFIHYTGVTKPWHDWADYASADYFRNIYNISPWRNI
ncbi:glycosyltransferase family 8 protein, partial [Escherichia coli]|uniref:glycosyltransferase family 8 protein n=1 Tax=Escherichia coli TaxID=562 RepID=UPI00274262DE